MILKLKCVGCGEKAVRDIPPGRDEMPFCSECGSPMIVELAIGTPSTLKPHEWDPNTECCLYCKVPRTVVVQGEIIPGCRIRSEQRCQ